MPNRIQLELQRHGLQRTLYKLLFKAVDVVVTFKILRGVVIERCNPAFLECPDGYVAKYLTTTELEKFTVNPENQLTGDFVAGGLSKGDQCLGICHGDQLASYGWYAFGPTPIDPPELSVDFDSKYAYMYNGFTSVRHRGKRLHAIGMTLALQHCQARGYTGLVSYIEANNFDSLKSSFRMGYEHFGSVYVVKLFGRWVAHSSPGCKKYSFALQPTAKTVCARGNRVGKARIALEAMCRDKYLLRRVVPPKALPGLHRAEKSSGSLSAVSAISRTPAR